MSTKTYEEIVRAHGTADTRLRMLRAEFVAASEERDAAVRDAKFMVEHQAAVEELQALWIEVEVAKALLEERWIKSHEDLALLRQSLPSSS